MWLCCGSSFERRLTCILSRLLILKRRISWSWRQEEVAISTLISKHWNSFIQHDPVLIQFWQYSFCINLNLTRVCMLLWGGSLASSGEAFQCGNFLSVFLIYGSQRLVLDRFKFDDFFCGSGCWYLHFINHVQVTKAQKVQASADGRDAKGKLSIWGSFFVRILSYSVWWWFLFEWLGCAVVAKESKAAFLAGVKGNGTVGSKRKGASSAEPPFKFGTSEAKVRFRLVRSLLGQQSILHWSVSLAKFLFLVPHRINQLPGGQLLKTILWSESKN